MKRYYEAHVTIEEGDLVRSVVKYAVEGIGWKFSAIDGDIVSGPGVRFYGTRHWNEKIGDIKAVELLNEAADRLVSAGINVVRRKIELVLYDDRSSKVRPCDGACPECHLEDLTP